jgi:hypothetical protein
VPLSETVPPRAFTEPEITAGFALGSFESPEALKAISSALIVELRRREGSCHVKVPFCTASDPTLQLHGLCASPFGWDAPPAAAFLALPEDEPVCGSLPASRLTEGSVSVIDSIWALRAVRSVFPILISARRKEAMGFVFSPAFCVARKFESEAVPEAAM